MTEKAEKTEKGEEASGKEKVVDFIKQEGYPRLLCEAVPNEKCLPCLLCEPVCPTRAIKVNFNKTREDYGPLRQGIKGKIAVDQEKCNLCGRCAKFCKAFLLMDRADREKDPRNLVPYEQLLVDEELCDYCGLCVPICPEEAIAVEGEPLAVAEGEEEFKGKIEIDQDLCIGCGRCAQVCPYQAMDIKKPFAGEIKLIEKNLARCDPLGCQACFNVCPAKCWYVDERGKAAPVKDQCIFCGACEKACPVSAIRGGAVRCQAYGDKGDALGRGMERGHLRHKDRPAAAPGCERGRLSRRRSSAIHCLRPRSPRLIPSSCGWWRKP